MTELSQYVFNHHKWLSRMNAIVARHWLRRNDKSLKFNCFQVRGAQLFWGKGHNCLTVFLWTKVLYNDMVVFLIGLTSLLAVHTNKIENIDGIEQQRNRKKCFCCLNDIMSNAIASKQFIFYRQLFNFLLAVSEATWIKKYLRSKQFRSSDRKFYLWMGIQTM